MHLSAGELLRREVQSGSALGKSCAQLMKDGQLVPLATTLALLHTAMTQSTHSNFLIDGFPRNVEQAKAFELQVGKPKLVIFLECPKSVMEERLKKRGETSGRTDDTPETILKRFDTFERESLPVASYYESVNPKILLKLSAVPPADLVYKDIHEALQNLQGPSPSLPLDCNAVQCPLSST